MKTMGKVANLFRAPKRREPMEELSEVEVLADVGFAAAVMPGPAASGRFCWRTGKRWRP